MAFEYSYMAEELLGTGVLSALLTSIPSSILGIISYLLTAMALYTAAVRRGLNRPWLAWIPVVNCWILGSLSDQYRYVVKNEIKSKRKLLLVLNILMSIIGLAMAGIGIAVVVNLVGGSIRGFGHHQMTEAVLGPVVGIVGLCLPLAGIAIAYAVIRYMALYDVYRSMDPSNCVLFLVLSIVFSVTEPFFLFFSRNKDMGMPPRRQEPVYEEPQWEPPAQEPWLLEDNKDYL